MIVASLKVVGWFALCVAAGVHAQPSGVGGGFPTKPLRIIVTTPPGSGADFVSRTVGNELAVLYKQQVIVENRPGAGGLIGAQALATAPADGYTIGLASTAHVVAPMLQAKPPYRPIEDFTPIIEIGSVTNLVIVGPSVAATTLQAFIAHAKAHPGKLNFLSLGDGTAAHLSAVIFNQAAGIDTVHVPFKSVADANTALLAGEVHHAVFLVPAATPLVKGGKVRALAVTSATRLPAFPDVPTVVELGLPNAVSDALFGYLAPANVAREIVDKLNADIAAIVRRPDIRERLATVAVAPAGDYRPDSYGAHLKIEQDRYRKLIDAIGLKRP